MEYQDLEDVYEFHRNMRRTPWLKLFPHWWDEKDAFLNAIGDEIERIKALAIFTLLNIGIKPPVMIWKESLIHEEYKVSHNLTKLPGSVTIQAPLYKTWGTIFLTNNTPNNIDGLTLSLDDSNMLIINQLINQGDTILIDLTNDLVKINDDIASAQKIGDGLPYFITQQNNEEYQKNTPLHNEVIRLKIETDSQIDCDIDVEITLENVVFTDEQNIEITALEAVPIDKVELYVNYDFEFNEAYNGWHKVFEKKYEEKTNVLYDMITTQYYAKEFYVDVWFKTLQYPYKVGFPCYQNADKNSMYRVNERLDTWGIQLGLDRRMYKNNIDEKEYYRTYPVYYPYDIEQDYWYYKRLVNEYAWVDGNIDDIDIKDSEGNNVIRLYSINPFIEDFVVHAKSVYSDEIENINYMKYTPVVILQESSKKNYQQIPFTNVQNLLTNNDKSAHVTLLNKNGLNINSLKYQSKELWTYFDLSNLPENINIDNIEVLVEGYSTDNKKDKYSTENTGLLIPALNSNENIFIPLTADKNYQLSNQVITYSSNYLIDYLKEIQDYVDEKIEQKATIGVFTVNLGEIAHIPFELQENNEEVNDITDVWVYYNDSIVVSGKYKDGYIDVSVPRKSTITKMTIVCKSEHHKPFTTVIDVGKDYTYQKDKFGEFIYNYTYKKDKKGHEIIDPKTGEKVIETQTKIIDKTYLYGPLMDNKAQNIVITDDWHTKDARNVLQKQGLYFRNILENNNAQSGTTVHIQNVTLKISYSEKKSNFLLTTDVYTDVEKPYVGEYVMTITNTGQKPLSTHVDVVCTANIQLEKNSIPVELQIGDSHTDKIKITAPPPIDDGIYDILTVCENTKRKDIIEIVSEGLIETGIKLQPHHGKYSEEMILQAEITTADGNLIDNVEDNTHFYINNYLVQGTKTSTDNKVFLTFTPNDTQNEGLVHSGIGILDVKYDGSEKYASSHRRTQIFIGKDGTEMTLEGYEATPMNKPYDITAYVTYEDNGEIKNVTEGNVIFYLDDAKLGEVSGSSNINGVFHLQISSMDYAAGNYMLYAQYLNSDKYSYAEASQPLKIIDGNVTLSVVDITAHPQETITLRAIAQDGNKEIITSGKVDFLVNGKELNIDIKNVDIVNGVASTEYTLNVNLPDDKIHKYTIQAKYHSSGYSSEPGTGTLAIEKQNVNISSMTHFEGSQYEPLGFYLQLTDDQNEPIQEGKVSINIIGQPDVHGEANIDKDGGCRLVCNPVSSIQLWDKMGDYNFIIKGDADPYITQNGQRINLADKYQSLLNDATNDNLYFIYQKEEELKNSDNEIVFQIDKETGILSYYNDKHNPVEDYLFIKDKHLYRRTSTKNRKYDTGIYDVRFTYEGTQRYKKKARYLEEALTIDLHDINLDLHSYELEYGSTHKTICFASNYSEEDDSTTNTAVNGKVKFYIDDKYLTTSNIQDNKAIISPTLYYKILYGNHLLKAMYFNNGINSTKTYSTFELTKITPLLTVSLDSQIKSTISTVTVKINKPSGIDESILITGFVNVYLDGEKVGSLYLFGNDKYQGIIDDGKSGSRHLLPIKNYDGIKFYVMMPDDIDINNGHILTVEYEGNSVIKEASKNVNLQQTSSAVSLSCDSIIIAKNEECIVPITVNASTTKHIINEGSIEVVLNNNVVASAPVQNNKATLIWTPVNNNYIIKYVNNSGTYYDNHEYSLSNLNITLTDPQTYINFSEGCRYRTLQNAIQCLTENGTLNIKDKCRLQESLTIRKSVHIQGDNNALLIKDLNNLVSNLSNIHIHNFQELPDLYEIKDMDIKFLNTNDFYIEDREIYLKSDNTHIYLMEDNKFYAKKIINLQDIKSDITLTIGQDAYVYIDNIEFTSDDGNVIEDFNIINLGHLKITHSIINKAIKIQNSNILDINRCLVYGSIYGPVNDINNNWWGQNKAPYNVDNNIILTLETVENPPIINENIQVVGRLIGANGKMYNIPETDFMLTADTGYFSLDNGKTVNSVIETSYFDATKEGKIYITVDNETISQDIYEYERKTEIIINPTLELPIGYYVTVSAQVKRCVDSYNNYEDIQGYIDFYFDDKKIGRSRIENNQGSVVFYIKDGLSVYNAGLHKLKAIFIPIDYYFTSSNEIDVTLVTNNNILYVSQAGNDEDNGTYDAPLKTIKQAVAKAEQGYTIYLQDDKYDENEIVIDKNLNIKSYNGLSKFESLDGCIFDLSHKEVTIRGLHFENNERIFKNSNNSYIYQSVFKNNEKILSSGTVLYSVVLNENLTKIQNCFKYCWFGTNTPRQNLGDVNDYVLMSYKTSKDILYKGIVATITTMLQTYRHHGTGIAYTDYKLENNLPLRIAHFLSKEALLKPIETYTYNNQATSLLNTNKESDATNIILKYQDTYYEPISSINFEITNHFDEKINDGYIIFNIKSKGKKQTVEVDDGQAIFNCGELSYGTYVIESTYYNNNIITKNIINITIKPEDIIIKDLDIDNGDHAHNLSILAYFVDNYGTSINNEKVNIYIDDIFIKQLTINNGYIQDILQYKMLKSGNHILRFTNKKISTNYDTFTYDFDFASQTKNTSVYFDYDKISLNQSSNLYITVNDDEKRVQSGTISVVFDNKILYENAPLNNGTFVIENFKVEEKGRHYIFIDYNGEQGYYNPSFKQQTINADIFEVQFTNIPSEISLGINQRISVVSDIKDASNQIVSKGYVNIYIDNILVSEKNNVNIGKIIYEDDLPINIVPGFHKLIFEYIDESETYANTIASTILNIQCISTEIELYNNIGFPNQLLNIKYDIKTEYGKANTGKFSLIFKDEYEEDKVYTSTVSDSASNYISITVPDLPSGEYDMQARYTDASGMYDSKQIDTKLIIDKNNVIMTPKLNHYYADEDFVYVVDVVNKDGKIVKEGTADIYIDNVLECENIKIINGQIIANLMFSQARHYPITIIFNENDYYLETSYLQDFTVNNVPIEDIEITTTNNKITELDFITINNHNVDDGIIDIHIDGKQIGSYYVAESNKFFDIDISTLSKGTHKITLEYHDSQIFDKFNTTKYINIQGKTVAITVDDIFATPKSIINITANLSEAIDGTIKYYINNDYIGLSQLNNEQTSTLTYTIPINLTEENYTLTAKFIGNDYYDESIASSTLHLTKNNTNFNIGNDITAFYQETLSIPINVTNVDTNSLIKFYIKKTDNITEEETTTFIGDCIISENDTFKYTLSNQFIAGEYTILAKYDGSQIYTEASSECKLTINSFEPTINIPTQLNVYIGGDFIIKNGFLNIQESAINIGTITCKQGNNVWFTQEAGKIITYQMPSDIITNQNLTLTYTCEDDGKYLDASTDITIVMEKNEIELNTEMPEVIDYNKPFTIGIKATSDTTHIKINTTASCTHADNITLEDGSGTFNVTIPFPNTPLSTETLTIKTPQISTQAFLVKSINRTINISSHSYITVDSSQLKTPINAHTLTEAINLVSNYGTIQVNTSLNNETVNINKDVTIKGNVELSNCTINNKSNKITIEGLTFKNGSSISNDSTANIINCTFKDNSKTIIKSSNQLKVEKCKFENNNVQNGTCINITNKNAHTEITKCQFNGNTASSNGTCINSNKGNDISISYSSFINNSNSSNVSACIYIRGNISIISNVFYNNTNTYDIRIIDGYVNAHTNLFDGSNQCIYFNNGTGDLDLNYWGQNYDDDTDIGIDNVDINNWLISRFEYERKYSDKYFIKGVINQYVNTLEKEISTINDIDLPFPITINNSDTYNDTNNNTKYYQLNETYTVQNINNCKIGQEAIK